MREEVLKLLSKFKETENAGIEHFQSNKEDFVPIRNVITNESVLRSFYTKKNKFDLPHLFKKEGKTLFINWALFQDYINTINEMQRLAQDILIMLEQEKGLNSNQIAVKLNKFYPKHSRGSWYMWLVNIWKLKERNPSIIKVSNRLLNFLRWYVEEGYKL